MCVPIALLSRQWPEALCHTFMHVVQVKKHTDMRESHAKHRTQNGCYSGMSVCFFTRATCKNVQQNLIPRATAYYVGHGYNGGIRWRASVQCGSSTSEEWVSEGCKRLTHATRPVCFWSGRVVFGHSSRYWSLVTFSAYGYCPRPTWHCGMGWNICFGRHL